MTQYLEINLQDYDLNSAFIKVETPSEAVCVCCLGKKGSFTYLRSCVHAKFLQEFIKDKQNNQQLLICSQCHGFIKKVNNFQMQVKENVRILEEELQAPTANQIFKENGLIAIKLPTIELLPTTANTIPKVVDVKSLATQLDEAKYKPESKKHNESKKHDETKKHNDSKKHDESKKHTKHDECKKHNESKNHDVDNNTPSAQTSLPANRKRAFRQPYNRRQGLRSRKQATTEKPAPDVLTNQKQVANTPTPNGSPIQTYQKQAPNTETTEKCSLQLSSSFLKNLLESKQNVGRLLTSLTEFKKNEDQTECAKSFREDSLESTNKSPVDGKEESDSDTDSNYSEPDMVVMKEEVDESNSLRKD